MNSCICRLEKIQETILTALASRGKDDINQKSKTAHIITCTGKQCLGPHNFRVKSYYQNQPETGTTKA